MMLLDKPFTKEEIRNTLDMLDGNISRICVSDNAEEIVRSLGFAINRLSMIAYSRVKQLSVNKEESN